MVKLLAITSKDKSIQHRIQWIMTTVSWKSQKCVFFYITIKHLFNLSQFNKFSTIISHSGEYFVYASVHVWLLMSVRPCSYLGCWKGLLIGPDPTWNIVLSAEHKLPQGIRAGTFLLLPFSTTPINWKEITNTALSLPVHCVYLISFCGQRRNVKSMSLGLLTDFKEGSQFKYVWSNNHKCSAHTWM